MIYICPPKKCFENQVKTWVLVEKKHHMKRLININDVENGLLNQENTLEVSSGIFYSEHFVNLPIHTRFLYLIIANECDKRNTNELPIDDIDFKKRLECSKNQGIKYLKELEKINLVTYEDGTIYFIHKEIIVT